MSSNVKDVLAFLNGTATVTYRGTTVRYVNDGGDSYDNTSRFYVASRDAYGAPEAVIHVQCYRDHEDGFADAWEAFIDSCPTIDPDDAVEAWEMDGKTPLDYAREAHPELQFREELAPFAREILASWENMNLVEGYELQSNASGTGIVDVGHCANMVPANFADIEFSA